MDDGGGDLAERERKLGECTTGGRGGAITGSWCSGTLRIMTGWKDEASRCATWCG